jgi:diguanylate cyclase (GGDEF)-like protein
LTGAAERELHHTLERALRRLGLSPVVPPDLTGWRKLLDWANAAYQEAEEARYTMERSIEISSEEMRELHQVLRRQAREDVLTGMPNRAALGDVLTAALDRRCPGRLLAVLFIDLDGFKLVNDSLGHAAGDDLLLHAAERIQTAIREADVAARLGGDEFVVVCAELDEVATALAVARRIATSLERPFRVAGQDAVVTASIGVAVADDADTTADDLLRRADLAMYEAKATGRGQLVVFDDEMQQRVNGRLSLENSLRQAIANDEFRLHFQPIVRLSDRRTIGLEALVRWHRPGHGLVMPEAFIPIAEETRLITAIDTWVVESACAQFTEWPLAREGATLAVNLSARDLHAPDIVEVVGQTLRRTGLAPDRLVLELTESTMVSGNPAVASNLAWLQALGVRLAIDDFGTGYSSLSYLQRIPAQLLKLDRSFVSPLVEDGPASTVVGAIVTMGHALGLKIIAEGVEVPEQADRLTRLGCDAAQGWLFAHPAPLAELTLPTTTEPVRHSTV